MTDTVNQTARVVMPEPVGVIRPVRVERQQWHRIDRAEGELEIGYDASDRPVRIEYHWHRYFSRANPALEDVYTGELWARRPGGDWLYLIRPVAEHFIVAGHDAVRALLRKHLDVDVGE